MPQGKFVKTIYNNFVYCLFIPHFTQFISHFFANIVLMDGCTFLDIAEKYFTVENKLINSFNLVKKSEAKLN